jgi:hypothetical protein
LGNGRLTSFWHDPWVGNVSNLAFFSLAFSLYRLKKRCRWQRSIIQILYRIFGGYVGAGGFLSGKNCYSQICWPCAIR